MKLITRNTDYAVRALSFIAKGGKEMVSAGELVKNLKIPRPFLRKILQTLNRKGLLKSYKGKGGGFALVVSPDKIFLVDLIKMFQGPLKLNECVFKRRICPNKGSCILGKRLDAVEKYVVSELKSITIGSLYARNV